MKRRIAVLITMIITMIGFNIYAQDKTQEQFVVSQSKYTFDKTNSELSAMIVAADWKITVIHDLQATLKKNGKDVEPVKILEICKPEYSGRLLEVDSLRIYSPLMPCRISVHQTKDGAVYVSRMNSGLMAKQIGGLVEEVMDSAFNEIESILKRISK